MNKKQQLFRVLASLQPTEKAYIRKFGFKTQKSDAIIFQLLDLIEKELKKGVEVDEDRIITLFKKLKPDADYIKIKARLLQIVFEGITEYDRQNNELSALFDMFLLAESLQKRKLLHDSIAVLKKAEKLAWELDELEFLIRIKIQILFAYSYTKVFTKDDLSVSLFEDVFADIELLRKKIHVKDSAQKMHHFQKLIGLPRSEEDQKLFDDISNSEGLKVPLKDLDNTTKIDQTLTNCILYFTKSEFQHVIEACKSFTESYQRPQKENKKLQGRLIALYDSQMQACLLSKQFEEFELAYEQFSSLEIQQPEYIRLKAGVDLYVRCIHSIYTRKLDEFRLLNQEFDQLADDELLPNYRKVSVAYFLVLGLFVAQDWALANSRIAWLYQQKDYSVRYDIDIALKVMNLLIQVEREEWFHLEYSIRNFHQYLDSRERKFEIENSLLKFLKKLLQQVTREKFYFLLKELRSDIQSAIEKNPQEIHFLQSFDLLSWIEGKLGKTPFADLYLERIDILK
jgi:hypothetical protein